MTEKTFTLEELAEDFDLTPRTARHYVENLLPEHHKTGRGKVARYGMDTWHCFAFIRRAKEEGLTNQQIADVLAKISQEQVDRVAMGIEELSIVPISPMAFDEPDRMSAPMYSMSERVFARMKSPVDEEAAPMFEKRCSELRREIRPSARASESHPPARWQVLYSDDTLQITHQGEASLEQREQVRLAARLIKKILGD
jgi:DNA-binding transcriptional MerR regulator